MTTHANNHFEIAVKALSFRNCGFSFEIGSLMFRDTLTRMVTAKALPYETLTA